MDLIVAGVAGHVAQDGANTLLHSFRVRIHVRLPANLLPCQIQVNEHASLQIAPPATIGCCEKRIALAQVAHRDRVTTPTLSACKSQQHGSATHKCMDRRAQEPDYDAVEPARNRRRWSGSRRRERHNTPHFSSVLTLHPSKFVNIIYKEN